MHKNPAIVSCLATHKNAMASDTTRLHRVSTDERKHENQTLDETQDVPRMSLLHHGQSSSLRSYAATRSSSSTEGRYRVKSWSRPDPPIEEVDRSGSANTEKKHPFDAMREQIEINLHMCIAAIVAYLLVGMIAYSFVFEDWTIVDSLYFSVVTFTTVGYGDIAPESQGGRLFTCFFALGGIAFLGMALGTIGNNILADEKAAFRKVHEKRKQEMAKLFDRSNVPPSEESDEEYPSFPSILKVGGTPALHIHATVKSVKSWAFTKMRVILPFAPIVFTLLLGSFAIQLFDGWTTGIDAFYYCIITAATIGYGDVTPYTPSMRWYAVVFIPISVGVTGVMLGGVAALIMNRKKTKLVEGIVDYDITLADLKLIDSNQDGSVNRLDFIQFMLVGMDIVDRQFLQDLHDQFSNLDIDNNGVLQKRDLELMAELKRRRATA